MNCLACNNENPLAPQSIYCPRCLDQKVNRQDKSWIGAAIVGLWVFTVLGGAACYWVFR